MHKTVKSARILREQLLADPYRPRYHFVIPEDDGNPGDPNGAFYANGHYHLMYLYKRRDVGFCWGHISSHDLIHWRHHPDAIGPGEGDSGCFSGGAFLDDDGTAYLSYWKLGKGNGIGIAKSKDLWYEKWTKVPGSVISCSEFGLLEQKKDNGEINLIACADPSNIWKKRATYYMQTGNLVALNKYGRDKNHPFYGNNHGDWVDLFKSSDLITWTHLHRFYSHPESEAWPDATEDDMCPSFLPLPASADGGKWSGKYLQLFIAHNKGCQYYIGTYDESADKFIPELHGRMSWVDNTYFAPEALIDAKGRQIMWAWLLDNPGNSQDQLMRGWSGVYGLPRLLWLGEDGLLHQKVPPEFEALRFNAKHWPKFSIDSDKKIPLNGLTGTSCEIILSIKPKSARRVGLMVCASPNEEEATYLYYDLKSNVLVFDARKSSLKKIGRCVQEQAPFTLLPNENLVFHVFIDQCVVEIYVNEKQAICRRVYPTLRESSNISVYAQDGDVEVLDVHAWDLSPSNPY